jgi:tRNA nucleotidyltransferase (CCA-adding enzyme)
MTVHRVSQSISAEDQGRWEHFAHCADIGVRGIGSSPGAAFEQAALALTAVITDPSRIASRQAVSIRCSAPDLEVLLVEWLHCLVFEMATWGMLFARFAATVEDNELHGTAWGEEVVAERHRPAAEVKGATFTSLRVGQDENGNWVAQCIVDV